MALPFKLPTRSRLAVSTLAALALAALTPVAHPAENETCVVVVSPDVPITDISLDDLRRIFLFKQRFWRPNQPITLLYSESNLEPDSCLLRGLYAMDQQSLKTLILQRLYSGDIDLAPKIVSSDETAVSFVRNGHGLISLVRSDALGEGPIRTLTIDGKAPGSADYPLRR